MIARIPIVRDGGHPGGVVDVVQRREHHRLAAEGLLRADCAPRAGSVPARSGRPRTSVTLPSGMSRQPGGPIHEFPLPAEPLPASGERCAPEIGDQIQHEHFHRYLIALRFCEGKDVLDVACGEGYGAALLESGRPNRRRRRLLTRGDRPRRDPLRIRARHVRAGRRDGGPARVLVGGHGRLL